MRSTNNWWCLRMVGLLLEMTTGGFGGPTILRNQQLFEDMSSLATLGDYIVPRRSPNSNILNHLQRTRNCSMVVSRALLRRCDSVRRAANRVDRCDWLCWWKWIWKRHDDIVDVNGCEAVNNDHCDHDNGNGYNDDDDKFDDNDSDDDDIGKHMKTLLTMILGGRPKSEHATKSQSPGANQHGHIINNLLILN